MTLIPSTRQCQLLPFDHGVFVDHPNEVVGVDIPCNRQPPSMFIPMLVHALRLKDTPITQHSLNLVEDCRVLLSNRQVGSTVTEMHAPFTIKEAGNVRPLHWSQFVHMWIISRGPDLHKSIV